MTGTSKKRAIFAPAFASACCDYQIEVPKRLSVSEAPVNEDECGMNDFPLDTLDLWPCTLELQENKRGQDAALPRQSGTPERGPRSRSWSRHVWEKLGEWKRPGHCWTFLSVPWSLSTASLGHCSRLTDREAYRTRAVFAGSIQCLYAVAVEGRWSGRLLIMAWICCAHTGWEARHGQCYERRPLLFQRSIAEQKMQPGKTAKPLSQK